MTEQTIIVSNRAGVHARPASMVVEATKFFKSSIQLKKGAKKINGKSILGVMTLEAGYGTEITIIAEGEDEKEAVAALVHLFETNFEED